MRWIEKKFRLSQRAKELNPKKLVPVTNRVHRPAVTSTTEPSAVISFSTAPDVQIFEKEAAPTTIVEEAEGRPVKIPVRLEPVLDNPRTLGRNSPCPCGSGKKVKKCHGR